MSTPKAPTQQISLRLDDGVIARVDALLPALLRGGA